MPRIVRRLIFILLSLLLALAIFLAVFIPVTIRRSFPRVSGEVRLEGLKAPVDIFRDGSGVPHIYATSTYDLFFAQGYVHAQDRFWQMDYWRHIGSGRLSEMFGPDLVDTDKFLRTLGWARVVEEELRDTNPTSLEILHAYADGVNSYLADHRGSRLSLEYAVLGLTNPDYQPEPWQPLHTLTWAKVMAWDLGGNLDMEIERALLLKTLTAEQLAELYPPYPADHPVIVPGFQLEGQAAVRPAVEMDRQSLAAFYPALEAARRQLDSVNEVLSPASAGIGSNSLAISGDMTATGMPLLANDPHLAAQIPSIWYQVGLHCLPKSPACPFEMAGFSFAGAPGVIIGHNDRIAWGMTNLDPDVMDLYIEKINPANPDQYEVNGEWVDMRLVKETVQVAGSEPVELTVRYTRHGPVISETYLPEDFTQNAGIQLPEQYAIALRWTALEPAYTFTAIWLLNRARNWEEFRAAARSFAVPSQNLIYADVDGNIAYQAPGNVPIRAAGDGMLPVPGWTDEYEWTGFIPFEQLPFALNPPQGYLTTANNAVISPDYPYLITNVWSYGYRAACINVKIEAAPGPIDIAYMQKLQGDNTNLNARTLVPILLDLVPEDARQQQALQLLQGWDYQDEMDSAPAALFEVFWKNLLAVTFHDDLPEDSWPGGDDRWYTVVRNLVEQPESQWWDDRSTPVVEQRDQIFSQAFAAAVSELEGLLGEKPEAWAWGKLHTLTLQNQTFGRSGIAPIEALFNRGPYQTAGGNDIVNATGWDAQAGYQVSWLPSMRMIVDLGDLKNSQTIHLTGQSGHAYNKHYADMTDMWRTIQYQPMLWERQQNETETEGHLRLVP